MKTPNNFIQGLLWALLISCIMYLTHGISFWLGYRYAEKKLVCDRGRCMEQILKYTK